MDLTQGGEGAASELLQVEAHVWNHIFHLISSMSLRCAVELSIPDIIHNHGQPMMHSKMVDALPVAAARTGHVQRLMRFLVHSGFFVLQRNGDGEQGYVLTPSSRLLLNKTTTSLSPFLSIMTDPVIMAPWQFLSRWFQGDEETAQETTHGTTVWKYMAQKPELGNMFNVAMANDSRILMKVLVEECGEVFKGVGSLVEVGGGIGECAMKIAKTFPHIKCKVLDLPGVVAAVPQKTTEDLEFVGGDMFESIPKGDAVFLKWILHDWSDEDCVKILTRCKEAIPCREEEGKVIIGDMVVDTAHGDLRSIETQLYWDLLMMVLPGGKEREEHEWHNAGFSQYKIAPVFRLWLLIELYPL